MNIKRSIKFLLAGLLLCLGPKEIIEAQSSTKTDSLLEVATTLFDNAEEENALEVYLRVLETDPFNFTALWHTSLLYAREGHRLSDKDKMMKLYQKSLHYAEIALKKYPNRGHSHFVYAVANGRISDIAKTSIRIEKSHIVKKHSEKAVRMIPDYAPAWHVLGLWHSKVANISSAEELAAGLISEGLPKGASNAKAEEYIKKAISMSPDEIQFKVGLARHYMRAGEKEKGKEVLNEALEMNPQNEIDRFYLREARRRLDES